MEIREQKYARWRFLFENNVLRRPGWLPAAEEVRELADLRAEHERLLAVVGEQDAEQLKLERRRDAELEARRAAQEATFLGKSTGAKPPKATVTDKALAEAQAKSDAAYDALQTFAKRAVKEITRLTPDLRAGLAEIVSQAEVKRAEARALQAEADQLEGSTNKLRNWLARFDGSSALGLISWSGLAVPMPKSPQTIEEVFGASDPFRQMADRTKPDEGEPYTGSSAFGTDDPNNLYSEEEIARPWEMTTNA